MTHSYGLQNQISTEHKVFTLPLDQVHPRKVNAYAITDIERLSESIQRSGLLQPVIVKKEAPDSYQLIAGERRFTAIKYLHEKYLSAGDTTKANLFNSIQAFVYENLPSDKEEQIYRDTNDYTRQMKDQYLQEEFVRHVYGEKKVVSWKAGFVMVRGTQRERSKLVRALLIEQNPDLDISEKTVRNYLAFLDRCNEDLKLATLMGKISIRDAMAISWNSSSEQTDAVNSIGKEVFKDYVEEGKLLSGSDSRKETRKHKPVSKQLHSYETKLIKLGEEYKKILADLETQTELSHEEQELVIKLNSVADAIARLNPTKPQS